MVTLLFAIVMSLLFWTAPAGAGIFSLSEADEIAIGREASAKVEQQSAVLRNNDVQRYISRLGHELAARSSRPHLPWRFRVIRDKQINAFALPGGFIYIHSKILEVVDNEAQLSGVIAHEIGHIEGYHHRAQIEKAMKYQMGLGVLGAVLGSGSGANYALLAGNMLARGQLTKYSRQAEADADRRGVILLQRSRFNPMAMSYFLQHLVKLEKGGAGGLSSFFADHPDAASRVAVTRKQAQRLPQWVWRRDSPEFLRITGRRQAAGFTPFRSPTIHRTERPGLRLPEPKARGMRSYDRHDNSNDHLQHDDGRPGARIPARPY